MLENGLYWEKYIQYMHSCQTFEINTNDRHLYTEITALCTKCDINIMLCRVYYSKVKSSHITIVYTEILLTQPYVICIDVP